MGNPKIQALVDALRSGDYRKGQGNLKKKDNAQEAPRYCCEGVMCELENVPVIRVFEGWNGVLTTEFASLRDRTGQDDPTASGFAPAYVWEGTGMNTSPNGTIANVYLPVYRISDVSTTDTGVFWLEFESWAQVPLASLNDFKPMYPKNLFTFDQIADLIEWAYLSD